MFPGAPPDKGDLLINILEAVVMREGRERRHLEHVGPTRSVRSSFFSLGRIVFDGPEVDDLVELLPFPEPTSISLKEQQTAHRDWKNQTSASAWIFTDPMRLDLNILRGLGPS